MIQHQCGIIQGLLNYINLAKATHSTLNLNLRCDGQAKIYLKATQKRAKKKIMTLLTIGQSAVAFPASTSL